VVASQTLLVELVARVDSVERAVDGIDRKTSNLGSTFGKVGKLAAGAFAAGAVLDFAKQSVDAFSTLEQSVGGVESVFAEASDTILKFGEDSAETVGLASSQYNTLATGLGGLLKSSGFSTDLDEIAAKTDGLIGIAADLSATYGGTTQQAVEALGSAFRGEADAAERFNLRLNAATVAAKAVELGLAETTSEVSDAAKATAIMTLVQEQSTDALGQFGREADTVAGKQARLTAKWEDAQAQIGAKLLPVVLKLFDAFEPLIPTIVDLVEASAPLIVALVPLVALIGKLATSLLPVLVSVIGPLAELIGNILTPVVDLLSDALGWLEEKIRGVVDWFKKLKPPAWLNSVGTTLGNLFGGGGSGRSFTGTGPLPSAAATFSTARAGSSVFASGGGFAVGGGIQVVIQTGVGDPVEIGRTVADYLRVFERSNGPRVA
jgi:hypothetical protein